MFDSFLEQMYNPLEQFKVYSIINLAIPNILGLDTILPTLTNTGIYLRASAKLLLEMVIKTLGSSIHEECVTYPVGGNNLTNRKVRGNIACYVKGVDEGSFDYLYINYINI